MKKGFTIVELLIAMALFTIVIGIAVGAFSNALRTQRQVAALIATQSNTSLALEQLAREVRTGYLFCHDPGSSSPTSSCSCAISHVGGGNQVWTCGSLDFWNAQSMNVHYSLLNNALAKSQNGKSGPFQPITGNNVKLQNLSFVLFGNIEGDHWTPRVTVAMTISPSSTDPAVASSTVSIQTTVSARQIDCTTGASPSC